MTKNFLIVEGGGSLSVTEEAVVGGMAEPRLTGAAPGTVTVQVSAPGLGSATVSVEAVVDAVAPEAVKASDSDGSGMRNKGYGDREL